MTMTIWPSPCIKVRPGGGILEPSFHPLPHPSLQKTIHLGALALGHFILVWLPDNLIGLTQLTCDSDWKYHGFSLIIYWKKGCQKKVQKHNGLLHIARVEETLWKCRFSSIFNFQKYICSAKINKNLFFLMPELWILGRLLPTSCQLPPTPDLQKTWYL